ncbi:MAG: hypothetical protein TREMPRED_002301, partial [Tremellales sp. Tagirdzhanova-0007]
LAEHTGPVNVVRYNHGAKYCLTGSADRTIRLWNPSLGKEIKCYRGHGHEVLALDISHDNAKFASCGVDKVVFIWDVASGTVVRRLQGHFGKINAVTFNRDAQVLASAGFDAKVMLWDMRAVARDPIQTIKDATSSITTLTIPSDIPELMTGGTDGIVRSYDLRMGKIAEDLVGAPISSISPSPTSSKDTLLVSSLDGKLRIFDRSNGTVLQTFAGHKTVDIRSKAAWNYGEGAVLTGDEDGRIWAWNVLDVSLKREDVEYFPKAAPLDPKPASSHKKAVTWVEISPNGKEMLTASNGMFLWGWFKRSANLDDLLDGTIKVWAKGSG